MTTSPRPTLAPPKHDKDAHDKLQCLYPRLYTQIQAAVEADRTPKQIGADLVQANPKRAAILQHIEGCADYLWQITRGLRRAQLLQEHRAEYRSEWPA